MTVDEKKAMQTILIDEIAQHQQDQPTMLIDALLADQGWAFLHHVLSRRAGMAAQAAQITGQLLRVLQRPPDEPVLEPRTSEEVA
jgi:hypothetical protein